METARSDEVLFSEIMERLRNGESIEYVSKTIVLDQSNGVFHPGSESGAQASYSIHMGDLIPNQSLRFIHCKIDAREDERLILFPIEHSHGFWRTTNARNFTVAWGSSAGSRCEIQGKEITRAIYDGEDITTYFSHIYGNISVWLYGNLLTDQLNDYEAEIYIQETEVHGSVMISGLDLSSAFLMRVIFKRAVTVEHLEIADNITCLDCIFEDDLSLLESRSSSTTIDGASFRGNITLPESYWYLPHWLIRITEWILELDNDPYDVKLAYGANADGSRNMLFRRWVQDTNYLRQFKQQHPIIYWIWLIVSDCGRSFSLWLMWSVALAVGFGFAFWKIVGEFYVNGSYRVVDLFHAMYFSVITFTTLGLGDVLPATHVGKWWVAAEVIVGYLMLGGLISIFADKLARRS
jgi:hypothetical protein